METILPFQCFVVNYFPFYPTYEEWKHYENGVGYGEWVHLFILPMRNGNTIALMNVFISFLLFILPMRNGNLK